MSREDEESSSVKVVPFREARWSIRWLLGGLAFLACWKSLALIDRQSLATIPALLVVVVAGLLPQCLLLVYPIISREPGSLRSLPLPKFTHVLKEFLVAIPVVILTMVAVAIANLTIQTVSPGSSLTPDALTNLAASPGRSEVVLMLIFAFTFAPIAEELFFRGFLYNAFRARMPLLLAAILQSIIFGFGHFFGAVHSMAAVVLGLMLTAVYEWRKTLVTPILVHMGINFISAVGIFFLMTVHANSPMIGVRGEIQQNKCVITEVLPESAASKAGLQVGDVIKSFDGETIHNFRQLREQTWLCRPGDSITLGIERSGTGMNAELVLQARSR